MTAARLVVLFGRQLIEQFPQRVPGDHGLAVRLGDAACTVLNPPSPMITAGCAVLNRASRSS
jgi:hypothetical protein